MIVTKHNKIVYENVLVVKSIHNSKDSQKKVWKVQTKISEFDCLTGYSILFLLFETNFVFVICSHVIWCVFVYTAFNSSRTKENMSNY